MVLFSQHIYHDEFEGIKDFEDFSIFKDLFLDFLQVFCHIFPLKKRFPVVKVYHYEIVKLFAHIRPEIPFFD